jgi:hypothetical protein
MFAPRLARVPDDRPLEAAAGRQAQAIEAALRGARMGLHRGRARTRTGQRQGTRAARADPRARAPGTRRGRLPGRHRARAPDPIGGRARRTARPARAGSCAARGARPRNRHPHQHRATRRQSPGHGQRGNASGCPSPPARAWPPPANEATPGAPRSATGPSWSTESPPCAQAAWPSRPSPTRSTTKANRQCVAARTGGSSVRAALGYKRGPKAPDPTGHTNPQNGRQDR